MMSVENSAIIKGPELYSNSWKQLLELVREMEQVLGERQEDLYELTGDTSDPMIYYERETYLEQSYILDWALELVTKLKYDIEDQNAEDLRENFDDIFEAAVDAKADIAHFYDEIDDIMSILDLQEGHLIYLPKEPIVHVPKLILSVSDDLLRLLSREPELLFSIAPTKFEEVIAEIFRRKGYEVELTKTTRDGGKDIIAFYNHMNVRTKFIIECKRYARHRKISLALVQRLLGVKIATRANKAILATTSTFTRDARNFSKDHLWDLDLKDYNDIVSWLSTIYI